MGPSGILLPQIVSADKVMQHPHRQKHGPVLLRLWVMIRSQLSTGEVGALGIRFL